MAIHWREDLKRRWPVMVYADPYTIWEWEATIAEILDREIGGPPFRLLVDRRYCQAPPTFFVRQMSAFLRQHHDRLRGGAIAIVARDTQSAGVARMTELILEGQQLPCAIRAFRDWDEAEHWLDGQQRTT
jgi:hypothetical protein